MKIWLISLTLLLLAAVLFIGWSYARFARAITTDIRRLVATAARNQVFVTADMVSTLPAPARRYSNTAAWSENRYRALSG
jgi:hypothetical protein